MRRRRLLAILGSGVALAAGGGGLAWSLRLERWAAPRILDDVQALPRRQWAIVLGATVRDDGTPSAVLGDRLEVARRLLAAGRVEQLLLSGNDHTEPHGEVAVMTRALVAAGIDPSVLVGDPDGVRTLATMRNARDRFGIAVAAICTQRFHLPRALWLAQAVGIDAIGVAADLQPYSHATRDGLREHAARVRAWIDVAVLGRAGG
ncbi:MAG: ElyC/SanA/YdcF family protein [Nannocystaceae bacterium]